MSDESKVYCPKCGKPMRKWIFVYLCHDCKLALTRQEIEEWNKGEIK